MWFKGIGGQYKSKYYKAISIGDDGDIFIGIRCGEFKWASKCYFILIGTDDDMKRELMKGE